jgi:hypothetical protein
VFKGPLYIDESKVKELVYLIEYVFNRPLYIDELKVKELVY